MSIVTVHGPNTFGVAGAGGPGTGGSVTAPGGAGGTVTATANMTNGLKFTFKWTGTTARPDADFDWAFPGGTPATAADTKTPAEVTYATAGSKTATLTVAAGAGPPAAGAYPITVLAVTGGPRSVQEEGAYDPGEHTVAEVLAHVEENPDELEEIYEAESNGKARTTLLSQLEALAPA